MIATVLKGQELTPPAEGEKAPPTWEQSQQELLASADELAAAVRVLDEGALTREYVTPFAKMEGAVLLDLVAMNMAYHGGQVNLIQMLAGDDKFHVPEGFTKF